MLLGGRFGYFKFFLFLGRGSQSRFLGRGCGKALFSEKKEVFSEKGEAIQ